MVRILGFHCHGSDSIPGQVTETPQVLRCSQKKFKSLLELGSTKPKVVRSVPLTGANGEVFIEKMQKQSKARKLTGYSLSSCLIWESLSLISCS